MALKTEDFIKELKEMKVTELNDLVKAIEEEFGVSAAAPVAVAEVEGTGSTEKTVELVSAGGNKIAVIKVVREIMGLALMEAKQFADNGGVIKEGIPEDEAEELANKLKEAGATVEIK